VGFNARRTERSWWADIARHDRRVEAEKVLHEKGKSEKGKSEKG